MLKLGALLTVCLIGITGLAQWHRSGPAAGPTRLVSAGDPAAVRVVGRSMVAPSDGLVPGALEGDLLFDWPATRVSAVVSEKASTASIIVVESNPQGGNYFDISLNGEYAQTVMTVGGENKWGITLASGAPTTVQVFHRNEAMLGVVIFRGIETDGEVSAPGPVDGALRFDVYGDSITCGAAMLVDSSVPADYCNPMAKFENAAAAYHQVLANMYDPPAQPTVASWSGKGLNMNCCGDTGPNMAALSHRVLASVDASPLYDFSASPRPDFVIVNLGTNDYSNPSMNDALFVASYLDWLEEIDKLYGSGGSMPIFLANGPINTNLPIQQLLADPRAATLNLHPLVQDTDQYSHPDLIGCGGHPNIAGHQKMAELAKPQIDKVLGRQ